MRPERIYGVLKLCIYALRVIKNGEELRYDYKMADSPWRKLVMKVNLILHPCFHLRGLGLLDMSESGGLG